MDLESDGVSDHHHTPNRPLSLLEKKQLKWSQEKGTLDKFSRLFKNNTHALFKIK